MIHYVAQQWGIKVAHGISIANHMTLKQEIQDYLGGLVQLQDCFKIEERCRRGQSQREI